MTIINFSIPKVLEQRVKQTIKTKGFPSKAELFRFAVIRYLDEMENLPLQNNKNIANLSLQLEKELKNKVSHVKIPSIQEQLKK